MAETAPSSVHPTTGAHVLISGGTSGVGLAAALTFAREGAARIVLAGRDRDRGQAARDAVAAHGADVLFISGDAGDANDSTRIVAEAGVALHGRVDTFVSAVAPQGHLGLIQQQNPHELERVLMGLVLPVMQMNRAVLPFMTEAGGTIVNVASDAAKVATPGESVAGGAMAAIAMFSRTVAMEVKRHGVRVHVVTPSLVAGTRTADRLMSDELGSKIFNKVLAKAHLGLPDAEDVAATIAWLAGPSATKMTGQVISVNGGISVG